MLKCTIEVLNIIVIIFLLHFFNVLYMALVNCAERILGPVPQSEGWLVISLVQDQAESFEQTFLL